jgi:hypothetical protein
VLKPLLEMPIEVVSLQKDMRGEDEGFLEKQSPGRDGIRRLAHARPEDSLAGKGLVEQGRQQVLGEMSIRLLEGTQITFGQKMEDEPVVALRQDLGGDAPGLLSHEDRPEIIFAPFLHPGDEGSFAMTRRTAQN